MLLLLLLLPDLGDLGAAVGRVGSTGGEDSAGTERGIRRRLRAVHQHPRVLRPTTLTRVHDQAALAQGDTRQAAGRHPHPITVVDGEGTKVDVAGDEATVDMGRRGRQSHDLLGDEPSWISDEGGPCQCEFLV